MRIFKKRCVGFLWIVLWLSYTLVLKLKFGKGWGHLMKALWPTNICIFYIFWLKYTGWLKFPPDSTVLTTIWPLVTSERSWYRHFQNQQKKCYRLICILPRLLCVFIKISISVDIGSFDVDLTPKRSKFDQTKGRNELITFSYNIRIQNGDSLWVIFQASALVIPDTHWPQLQYNSMTIISFKSYILQ